MPLKALSVLKKFYAKVALTQACLLSAVSGAVGLITPQLKMFVLQSQVENKASEQATEDPE